MERLSERIVAQFKTEHDMIVSDVRLYPAQGRWRSDFRMDVMRFTGFAKWHGPGFSNPLTISVDSWDTMTHLLKAGFTVERTESTGFELIEA